MLFRPDMMRAILEGRKTQTRRKVKPRWLKKDPPADAEAWARREIGGWSPAVRPFSPWGGPGDRLWVREPWGREVVTDRIAYLATEPYAPGIRWRPSIHMPREASRLQLEIVDVRRERVAAISDADALAEGIKAFSRHGSVVRYGIPAPDGLPAIDGEAGWPWHEWCASPAEAFLKLWQQINGRRSLASLEADPVVTVIEFARVYP
jgi:hypothetical protein